MKMLSREELLTKEPLKVVKVELGDGAYVFVRQMTGRERDRFEQSLLKSVRDHRGRLNFEQSMEDFRAKLAVNTVCDEVGNNLLSSEDIETLSTSMSAAKLERIVDIAQELNRITAEDRDALVKNLNNAPEDGSGLDSVS